ncbi:hypothetical protein [Pelagibacterium lacus]|uniref:hypothetical protein n=1 Tax=Pelagibacterium lacus TaxID=2282655 RepID=UPI0018F32FDB|nr:hypothetical protein [Pelagibacterium lacus]
MTIIKRKRSENFALIPNALADDERLSFEARGLLVYLLAKPDNWSVSINDLRAQGGIGRDKAYKLINELIEGGYISRDRCTDESTKRITGVNYTVFDCVQVGQKPLPENQDAYKELRDNNKYSPHSPPADSVELFDQLWQVFPMRPGSSENDAIRAFKKLDQAERALAVKAARHYAKQFRDDAAICQSALKFAPLSACNIDPLVCGAGEPVELAGVAEAVRPRIH